MTFPQMRSLFLILIIYTFIYSCANSNESVSKPEQLIPENSNLVLNIINFEVFKTDIRNNKFLKNLSSQKFNQRLDTIINNIDSLNLRQNVFIAFENSNNDYSIIGKLKDSSSIKKTIPLHHIIIDSVFVASTSQSTIDNLLLNSTTIYNRFNEVSNSDASFSIFLDNTQTRVLGKSIVNDSIQNFSKWASINVTLLPNQVEFNGVTFINDSIPEVLDLLKGSIPQENTIQDIAPINSDGFLSYTFDSFERLNTNLSIYKSIDNDSIVTNELFETIDEIGEVYLEGNSVIVLKSIDAQTTKDVLINSQKIESIHRNINIYQFNDTRLFNYAFSPLISKPQVSKYIVLDNFFVFANSESVLRQLISNYQNGTVLSKSDGYKNMMMSLSDESSLLVVANSSKLKEIITSVFNDDFKISNFKGYNFNAFQFIVDENFTHINGIIKKENARRQQNNITEEFNVSIDADILMAPHFVVNHRTNQKEIVVQDVNNILYLISNRGSVLWKKHINGNILGKVQQVDLYKNGRLQLAFTTPNRLYIIDRNGNDVLPFPLSFNNKITQPLSIFDYDNKKDYRFLVTQKNNLLMHNKDGKIVSGFNYSPSYSINTQPQHFKISGKDYIVFAAGNTMKIISRQGNNRITVKETIDFSGNPIFKYNDQFTTSSNNGELIQVNLKGAVSKQSLSLKNNHSLETTNKTLVTLSENNLTIKKRSVELDYGNYTLPKIFYINDKIYITITDLQSQKVFLFDSQAKPIVNFPVYGNSIIDLANIDNDNSLEFVVKGDTNTIVLYQK